MGVEKRKFQRLDIPLNVTVEIISDEELLRELPPMMMQCRNISPDGICVETPSIEVDGVNLLSGPPGARDNRLRLVIELTPGEEPLQALGEVCWYDISRDTPVFTYQIGVAFTAFDNDGRQRLARFLKTHTKGRTGIFHKLFR